MNTDKVKKNKSPAHPSSTPFNKSNLAAIFRKVSLFLNFFFFALSFVHGHFKMVKTDAVFTTCIIYAKFKNQNRMIN